MANQAKEKQASGLRAAVRSLQSTVADKVASEQPKGDPHGMIKQTLYLPPAVHEQLRTLAFTRKVSQQVLMRQGLNLIFEREGLPSWEEIEGKE